MACFHFQTLIFHRVFLAGSAFPNVNQYRPISVDNRFTITITDMEISCKGEHVDMKHLVEESKAKLEKTSDNKSVKNLTLSRCGRLEINCDLLDDMWRGTSIHIKANVVAVTGGERKWDLSGAAGKAHAKAEPGQNDGDDGANGVDGNHGNAGQDGGDVFIKTDNLSHRCL